MFTNLFCFPVVQSLFASENPLSPVRFFSDIFHKTDLTCAFLFSFCRFPLFGLALGMKSKKGGFYFSLDLPSRSIRQFVCFPPIFCTSFVQLAAICVNFETLRNFVSVLLSTLVFLLKFCSKLSLVFYFSVDYFSEQSLRIYDFLPRRMIRR